MTLKRSKSPYTIIVVAAIALSGCAAAPLVGLVNNEDVGKAVGAVVGALTGSQFGGGKGNTAMAVIGGVAGWVIGGNIGKHMDEADKARAARVASSSFEQPQPVVRSDTWRNGQYQYDTRVTTQRPYVAQGKTCKPFVQETTVRIGGKPETATKNGVACFEYGQAYPQGTWRIQD